MVGKINKKDLPQFKYYNVESFEQLDSDEYESMCTKLTDSEFVIDRMLSALNYLLKPAPIDYDTYIDILISSAKHFSDNNGGIRYIHTIIELFISDVEMNTSMNLKYSEVVIIVEEIHRLHSDFHKYNRKSISMYKRLIPRVIVLKNLINWAHSLLTSIPAIIGLPMDIMSAKREYNDLIYQYIKEYSKDVSYCNLSYLEYKGVKVETIISYEKLIFVNYDSIQKFKTDGRSFDFYALYNILHDDITYTVNIFNGSIPDFEFIVLHQYFGGVKLNLFGKNGISCFIVRRNSIERILCSSDEPCKRLTKYGCKFLLDSNTYCSTISKILYILGVVSDGLINIQEISDYNNEKRRNSNQKKKTDGILYDLDEIPIPEDVSVSRIYRSHGYSDITRTIESAPKRPHVRTGHYRHYKDGKIIYVRTTIVHEELYKGTTSAAGYSE